MRIFLLILLLTSQAFAGFVVPKIKAQDNSSAITLPNIDLPGKTATQSSTNNVYLATGNKNLLSDPDLQGSGTSAWLPGGSVTLSKDTVDTFNGQQTLKAVFSGTAGNDNMVYQQFAMPSGLSTNNIQWYVWVKTSATNLTFCPIGVGSGCVTTIPINGDGSWRLYSYIGTTNTTLGISINRNTATGTSATINIAYPSVELYTSPISSGTPQAWSGYHDSTCAWARTNTAYGDPTADASCTLVQRQNSNFGTITSALSGSDKLPGIVFTPSETKLYKICFFGTSFPSAANPGLGVQLVDGASVQQFEYAFQGLGANFSVGFSGCSFISGTASTSYTAKLQTKASSGSVTMSGNLEWTIESAE